MEEKTDGKSISLEKLEANRRNAKMSTGPKTMAGKRRSRSNALKHGILSSALLVREGEGAEDAAAFGKLLSGLRQQLTPVGALEELFVDKIAVCSWRLKRSLRAEAGLIMRAFVPGPRIDWESLGVEPNPKLDALKDHLYLPDDSALNRILRYETAVQHQFDDAINQLERLQRSRHGEHTRVPLSVELAKDSRE